MTIALTGGSGVGKTTVLGIWAGMGVYTIDADDVYHRLLRSDDALLASLRERFPEAFLSGGLDRKALGGIVFASPDKRRALERLTHGRVIDAVEKQIETAGQRGFTIAAVEAPLLPESPFRDRFDAVVGVTAPLEERIGRVIARDGVSREYAAVRIAAQPDDIYYRKTCLAVIENDAGPDALELRAKETLSRIVARLTQGDIPNA